MFAWFKRFFNKTTTQIVTKDVIVKNETFLDVNKISTFYLPASQVEGHLTVIPNRDGSIEAAIISGQKIEIFLKPESCWAVLHKATKLTFDVSDVTWSRV